MNIGPTTADSWREAVNTLSPYANEQTISLLPHSLEKYVDTYSAVIQSVYPVVVYIVYIRTKPSL